MTDIFHTAKLVNDVDFIHLSRKIIALTVTKRCLNKIIIVLKNKKLNAERETQY